MKLEQAQAETPGAIRIDRVEYPCGVQTWVSVERRPVFPRGWIIALFTPLAFSILWKPFLKSLPDFVLSDSYDGWIDASEEPVRLIALIFFAALLLTWVLLNTVATYRWQRPLLELPRQGAAVEELLTAALRGRAWGRPIATPQDIALMLSRSGHLGELVLISRDTWTQLVEPLTVAFEPVDLRSEWSRIDTLANQGEPNGATQSVTKLSTRRKRRIAVALVTTVMIAVGLPVAIGAGVLLFVTTRNLFASFIIIPVLMSIPYLIMVSLTKPQGANARWLAVPGGVVLRYRDRVELFDRRSSNLVMQQEGNLYWRVRLARGETEVGVDLSPEAAHLLARGWLCPVEPPSAEQLAELG